MKNTKKWNNDLEICNILVELIFYGLEKTWNMVEFLFHHDNCLDILTNLGFVIIIALSIKMLITIIVHAVQLKYNNNTNNV